MISGLHQDKRGRNYKKGEVIVTDQDLIKMFDDRKFERLPEEPERVLTTPADPPSEPDVLPEDGAGEAEPPEPEAEQEVLLGSPPAAASEKPAPVKAKKKKTSRKWEDDDE